MQRGIAGKQKRIQMKKRDWLQKIDTTTERFKISFQDVTEEAFNYKPEPHTWSVAQNIAHIILLNSSYFTHFSEIQSGNHNLFINEITGNLVTDSLVSLLPYTTSDRLMRANTWDKWQPSPGFIGKTILQEFEEHQQSFKNHVDAFTDELIEYERYHYMI